MRTSIVMAGILALAAAPALRAQIGNVSDPGGVVITGSEMAGGVPPGSQRDRGAVFVQDRSGLRFASPEVACAVSRAAEDAAADLRGGRVTPAGNPGRTLPVETQARLDALLASPDSAPDAAFLEALVAGGAQSEGERSAGWRLANALKGLLNGPNGCTSPRMPADRWSETFQAYDHFVDAASPSLVRAPSDAMLATQSVLARIIAAATAAARVD